MGDPVNPDVTAVQKSAAADKATPATASPGPDRADLRPENIQDAVIRLAGNSQDGIQTAVTSGLAGSPMSRFYAVNKVTKQALGTSACRSQRSEEQKSEVSGQRSAVRDQTSEDK